MLRDDGAAAGVWGLCGDSGLAAVEGGGTDPFDRCFVYGGQATTPWAAMFFFLDCCALSRS